MSSISDSGDHAKKRRLDDGDAPLSAATPKEPNRIDGSFAREMLSSMNQLLDHSRSQTASMARMEGELKGVKQRLEKVEGDVNIMKENINDLQEAVESMEKLTRHSCEALLGLTKGAAETNEALEGLANEALRPMVKSNDRMENKQRYLEVLLENHHRWKYSAPLPAEDSTSSQLLNDIKKQTCNMRFGSGDAASGDVGIRGNDDVPYEPDFLPHWKEFANALVGYRYAVRGLPEGAVSSLSIQSVELPADVITELSSALETTSFKKFRLEGIRNFGQVAINFALKYLRHNADLEGFHSIGNNFMRIDNIHQLCEIIQDHPSIHTIELDACRGNDMNGHDMLRSIVTAGRNKLKFLDLAHNSISTGESTFLADFLSTNAILHELILDDNNLNDADANSIAGALKHNTNLRYLSVAGNYLTEPGWEMMRKAEFDSTTLNSAACSNHTCHVQDKSTFNVCLNEDQYGDGQVLESSSKASRQKKIYSILSARHKACSNVQYFDDVQAGLLPYMLFTIQQCSNYHEGDNSPEQDEEDAMALSIVYEVTQRWDKSLSVFESLSSV